MSKYIIEINPEYEDSFKGVMILGAKDSNLFVDTLAVDNLEELNADYINEHFGELQDTAYQKGLEEGKQATWGLVADASSAEYQRGLEDAWEAARKIVEMTDPPYWEVFNEYKNNLFGKISAAEAIEKLKAYEEKQKADDKFEVGDEVRRKSAPENECGGIVTKDWENSYFIMWTDGSSGRWDKDKVVKTGRHFDIASILEDMKT